MKRTILIAQLTNRFRSLEVPSSDWQNIIVSHSDLWNRGRDRWRENDGSWLWNSEEAEALANVLVAEGMQACHGVVRVDIDFGGGVRGSNIDDIGDNLSIEQRTKNLIDFLREGSFSWKLIPKAP